MIYNIRHQVGEKKIARTRNLLKCVLTNDEHQTAIHVIGDVHGVRFIKSQNSKIVMFVPRKCP